MSLADLVSGFGDADRIPHPSELPRSLRAMAETFDAWKTADHKDCLPDPDVFAAAFNSDDCKEYIRKEKEAEEKNLDPVPHANSICTEGGCLAKLMSIFDPPQESAACKTWWDNLNVGTSADEAKAVAAIDDLAVSGMIKVMCASREPGVRCVELIEATSDPTKNELTKYCAGVSNESDKWCCLFTNLGCCWGSLTTMLVKMDPSLKDEVMAVNKGCSLGMDMCPNPFVVNNYLTVEFQIADFLNSLFKQLMQDVLAWLSLTKGVSLAISSTSARSGTAVTVKVQALANTNSDSIKAKMETTPTLTNTGKTATSLKAPVSRSSQPVGSASTASASVAVILALSHLF
jgi:hypothetical protein